jgi:hypothetical protein
LVAQPKYLKDLKAYARAKAHYSDEGEALRAVKDLNGESDRGAIILSATAIEDALEDRILQKLPALHSDEATRKQVFEVDGPIASFSRKLLMAYSMGLIDSSYRKKIDLVREIRNACAHSRMPISLAVPQLRTACEILLERSLADLIDHEPVTIRRAFILACNFIVLYIATGEKIETAEDQIAYWSKLHAEDGTVPTS